MKEHTKDKYPSPCDSCQASGTCALGNGCLDWQIRYRYRQKQINAFARGLLQEKKTEQTKFVYEHPDMIRRFLEQSPCKGCKIESVCEIPCSTYLRWYNARMEIARKKVGL